MTSTLIQYTGVTPPAETPAGADAAQAAAGTPTGIEAFLDVISPYMLVFFAAFFVAFVLTPVMQALANRYGIVDLPDLKRKAHIEPVAYLGGVAIFLGWLFGIAACYLITPGSVVADGSTTVNQMVFPFSVIIGAAAIMLLGLIDDVYGVSPRVKVGGQLIAAAFLASEAVGTRLVEDAVNLAGFPLPEIVVYVLGTLVIAGFVIGGCNAVNLIDGLDGLAAGVCGIAVMGFLVMAASVTFTHQQIGAPLTGPDLLADPVRLVMCLAILGAVLGFLPYNFNPASIFMGDAGSLLLGYLCVTTILFFAQVPVLGPMYVMAALIVFALPITDTALAIFRRKMRGKPILSPDDQHLHHLFRRTGMSVRKACLYMYGLATIFAALGCSMVLLGFRWRYVLAVFCVLFGFIIVTAYKYGHRQVVMDKFAQSAASDAGSQTQPQSQPPAPAQAMGKHPSGQTAANNDPALPEAPDLRANTNAGGA